MTGVNQMPQATMGQMSGQQMTAGGQMGQRPMGQFSPQSQGMGNARGQQNVGNATNYFLGKRIVITGASSGIGTALSYWYLNQGAVVILVGRDEEGLKAIASKFPMQACAVITNITDDYQCKDLIEAVKQKFVQLDNVHKSATVQTYNKEKNAMESQPKLDILINCAGVIFAGDLDNTFPQDHDYLMDVNLRAPFVLTNFFQDMLIPA